MIQYTSRENQGCKDSVVCISVDLEQGYLTIYSLFHGYLCELCLFEEICNLPYKTIMILVIVYDAPYLVIQMVRRHTENHWQSLLFQGYCSKVVIFHLKRLYNNHFPIHKKHDSWVMVSSFSIESIEEVLSIIDVICTDFISFRRF